MARGKQKVELGELDGAPVEATGVAIRNTGDGLSKALEVDPQLLHRSDGHVYVVLECTLDKVRFDPVDPEDEDSGWKRVHVLKAGTATLIDADVVKTAIDDQAKRIELHEEAKAGVQRLPMDLEAAHNKGEHDATPYAECTICVAEGRIEPDGKAEKSAPAKKARTPRKQTLQPVK